jgi:hypothetical protein
LDAGKVAKDGQRSFLSLIIYLNNDFEGIDDVVDVDDDDNDEIVLILT